MLNGMDDDDEDFDENNEGKYIILDI